MTVLLLLKGQPGSGKSTLGRALAQRLHWALVDKDDARDAFQHLAESEAQRGIDWNSLSYDVMFNVARTQLACGVSVIIDCPLARLELYNRAAELAQQAGATIVLVECEARDAEVWRQRVEARGQHDAGTARAHKPGSWAAVQGLLARNQNSESWPDTVDLTWRLQLDTSSCLLDDQVSSVLELIANAARKPPPALMGSREALISALSAPQLQPRLGSLLEGSSDVKIAVPCAALSRSARASSSKVVVAVKGRSGGELLLDCGSFWKGAPVHLVRMPCEALLQYANEDALRALARKLQAQGLLELPPALSRPPSRATASCHEAQTTMVRQRPSSRARPPSAPASTCMPAPAAPITALSSHAHTTPVKLQPQLQHRSSSRGSVAIGGAAGPALASPSVHCVEVQAEGGSDEEDCPAIITPFKASGPSHASKGSPPRSSAGACGGPATITQLGADPDPEALGSLARVLSLDDWVGPPPAGAPATAAAAEVQFGWLESHRPPKASSSLAYGPVPAAGVGASPLLQLAEEALQFSSDDEDCRWLSGPVRAPGRVRCTIATATAASQSNEQSQGVAVATGPASLPLLPASPPSSRKSADDFSRVFFAPWSAVSDSATQTGTAAGDTALGQCGARSLAAATQDPASAHFEAFLQHFAAGLPHLAMTLADLHSVHGTDGPIFAKAQFYMKTCLQIKDELVELMERHRAAAV